MVGSDFSCVCRNVGGNPRPNITWYHGNRKIGDTSFGKNILHFTNVTIQNSGKYTCMVQSYILKDEESTEVIVYGKYAVRTTACRQL